MPQNIYSIAARFGQTSFAFSKAVREDQAAEGRRMAAKDPCLKNRNKK